MPPKKSNPKLTRGIRAYRPIACVRCRNRQSYCDKEKPTCSQCHKANEECVYNPSRKVTVLASRITDLEQLVQELQDALASTSLTEVTPVTSHSSAHSSASEPGPSTLQDVDPGADADAQIPPLPEGLDNWIISPLGYPEWIGSSSSTSLGRGFRKLLGIFGPLSGELDIEWEIASYDPAALRNRRTSIESGMKLPHYKTAKRWFDAQYSMIGTIFAFVSPDVFEAYLMKAWEGLPNPDNQEECLMYCQVLLIMAFGQMYSINENVDEEGPPGFAFFTEALKYLPEIYDEPSVLFCGVLALIGYFMQNLNRRGAAFVYLGIAQRMAISLALHQEVSVPGQDEFMREQKRRTWWSIYSLDRILCVKYGNPVTMHDEDIGVALPERLPEEPEYCPAVVLRHYTILSKILGEIMSRIYRNTRKSGSGLMSAVEEIMDRLKRWEKEIPKQLRFSPARLSKSRESVSTFLHYYQCINMTARPLLFHLVKKRLHGPIEDRVKDWRTGLSDKTVSVIEACIMAARESINMMKIAAEKNLVANFGYMDGEHAFSAAIVLVMVCVAFPYDEANSTAMDAALAVLNDMANKGNHHIEARYQLLVQLRLVAGYSDELGGSGLNQDQFRAHGPPPYAPEPALPPMPAMPAVDVAMPDQMFPAGLENGDQRFFEMAYDEPDYNMDFDFNRWVQAPP